MQNQEKIVAAIAEYLLKATYPHGYEGRYFIASDDCQDIAADILAAIAPHLEAGAGKPNWNDAPEWATHLAQDMHGQWHWFRGEPKPDGQYWLASKYYNQRAFIPNMNWRDTLQERPK